MSAQTSRMPLRSRLKEALLACLYYTGVLSVMVRVRLRGRAIVFTYHRVLPSQSSAQSHSAPSIVVTPKTFDWHMRFIRRALRPVTADEFVRILKSGRRIPDRTCLVTFDDGWYDNLDFALPILKRHQVPAVLFVATDYVGTNRCFWQERMARLLYVLHEDTDAAGIFDELGMPEIRTLPAPRAREAIRELVDQLKRRPKGEIESLLRRLQDMAPASTEDCEDRFLSWDNVGRMTEGGLVAIGSHAVSHTPLTTLPLSEVEAELRRSAAIIGSTLGKAVTVLAYPNGNADTAVGAVARDAGYSAAFTTERGLVSSGCDRYLLPRVNIHESVGRSRGGFLGRIAGLC